MGAGVLAQTLMGASLLALLPAMSVASDKAGEGAGVTLAVEVVDSQGYPVPGARVQISRAGKAWSENADSLGVSRFSLSRKGRYDIAVTHEVFAPAKRERVILQRVGVTVVRIPLALADVPERVMIEEQTPTPSP